MSRLAIFRLLLASLIIVVFPHLKANEQEHVCHHFHQLWAPADSPDHRKYAPNRLVDFIHLRLDITPSFENRTVAGETTLQFKPISQAVSILTLDAVELTITDVQASTPISDWHLSSEQLVVHFEEPIAVGQRTTLTINHSAEPQKGMYFRTPEMGYRNGETHLFTQGEAIESRHWFPCFDSPNEKLTTEVICSVPEGMTVLSNGRKLSEVKNEQTGLVRFHWLQDKPHVNYLIAIVAGYFESVEGRYRDIPMAFYTLPSQIHMANNSFAGTVDMMEFIEAETGVPYPWDRYDQICVNDFVAGGMENTTLTILTDGTLFDDTTENLRSSQNLVAHELAHQWFGDLVTCKDWSHIWLNEGFATYFEALYHQHRDGDDAFRYAMLRKLGGWLNNPNDPVGIVNREYDSPMQQFGYRAYPKGAWVLHMIRSQIGPKLFRDFMKTYLNRHEYESVATEDLNRVLEQLTGKSFDQFFDQWVYHGGHPHLNVTYRWDAAQKMVKLSIKQNQKISEKVLLFRIPLTVRFKSGNQSTDFTIDVKSQSEDFYFPLPTKPSLVRIDPEFTTLMKLDLKLPTDMWHTQAADESDMIGRILAVRQLAKNETQKTLTTLKQRLQSDSFYGVRIEASRALRSLHSPNALEVLLSSTEQDDARVRHQVLSDIVSFYDNRVESLAIEVAKTNQNPLFRETAMGSLAAYTTDQVSRLIHQSLNTRSFQERIASGAISVIDQTADKDFVSPLLEYLMSASEETPSRVYTRGLAALAKSAQGLEDKTLVREFIIGKTAHPKPRIRSAAIRALGTLGDPRAIPVLNRLAGGHPDHPDRKSAESALSKVRSTEPPNRQLKHLQDSIAELKKNEASLKTELENLKKQLEGLRREADPIEE